MRLMVAMNTTTSPVAARAMMVFRPSSEVVAQTPRRVRAWTSRSAARAGSASTIAAARALPNRGQGRVSTSPVTAASTSAAAAHGRCRVSSAILRAFQART